MKIEEAVDNLRGKDDYTYKLNAYKIEAKKPKQEGLKNILCITNINEEAENKIKIYLERC